MRHDWILDVLSDLHSYALANDLPDLASKVEEALTLARREIGEESQTEDPLVFRARRRVH
ncbi:MAG: hypothetical protein C0524_16720 [Rhodobacter sp.]|nr:hypothetical protein [Rhodobacter sp.]